VSDAADNRGYRVTDADLARDGNAAIAVWRASLGHSEGRAAKFEWFYRAAPWGAHLQVLRAGPDQAIVGTAGVGWRRMRLGGRELRGGLLADMAVLPAHRTLGPAMQLQRAASDRALADGNFAYGFPNANAVPVVKRLGYAHVGDMVLYVRALRHAPYLERHLPRPLARLAGALLDAAFSAHDRLRSAHRGRLRVDWQRLPLDLVHPRWTAPDVLEGVHGPAELEWRFAHSPLTAFRFLYLRRHADAPPSAWFACHRDGDVLRICDFGFDPAESPQRCIARLAQAAAAEGCTSLAVECCLPDAERTALLRSGFIERQRRPIYARWKDGTRPPPLLRLTAFDEDE